MKKLILLVALIALSTTSVAGAQYHDERVVCAHNYCEVAPVIDGILVSPRMIALAVRANFVSVDKVTYSVGTVVTEFSCPDYLYTRDDPDIALMYGVCLTRASQVYLPSVIK